MSVPIHYPKFRLIPKSKANLAANAKQNGGELCICRTSCENRSVQPDKYGRQYQYCEEEYFPPITADAKLFCSHEEYV